MAKLSEMYISSSFRPNTDYTKYFKPDIYDYIDRASKVKQTNAPVPLIWRRDNNQTKILGNVLSSEKTGKGVRIDIKLNQEGRKFFDELKKTNEVRSMEFVVDNERSDKSDTPFKNDVYPNYITPYERYGSDIYNGWVDSPRRNNDFKIDFDFDDPYELIPNKLAKDICERTNTIKQNPACISDKLLFEHLNKEMKQMIVWKPNKKIEKLIDKVKFSECKRTGAITTIIFWKDGTKTMAKPSEEDSFNPFVGFDICILKKLFGNNSHHKRVYRDLVDEAWDEFMEDKMRRENL